MLSLTLNHVRNRFAKRFLPDQPGDTPALSAKERAMIILGRIAHQLRLTYIDGPRALLAGRYSHRQAAYIMLATLPVFLGTLFITVPGILFPSPGHKAFYHFACSVGSDFSALIPVILGAISTSLGFKIPLE